MVSFCQEKNPRPYKAFDKDQNHA